MPLQNLLMDDHVEEEDMLPAVLETDDRNVREPTHDDVVCDQVAAAEEVHPDVLELNGGDILDDAVGAAVEEYEQAAVLEQQKKEIVDASHVKERKQLRFGEDVVREVCPTNAVSGVFLYYND